MGFDVQGGSLQDTGSYFTQNSAVAAVGHPGLAGAVRQGPRVAQPAVAGCYSVALASRSPRQR